MDVLLFIINNLQEYVLFLYFQRNKSKKTTNCVNNIVQCIVLIFNIICMLFKLRGKTKSTRENMVKNPLQGFNIYL
jgi:hypothetical protein